MNNYNSYIRMYIYVSTEVVQRVYITICMYYFYALYRKLHACFKTGSFIVKGTSDKITVQFDTPSCTCRDWITWHLPCKHLLPFFGSTKTGLGQPTRSI